MDTNQKRKRPNKNWIERVYLLFTSILTESEQEDLLYSLVEYIIYQKGLDMDKQIRKIEKKVKSEAKDLKHLEKMDKKRDKVCDYGKKMMKKKKK